MYLYSIRKCHSYAIFILISQWQRPRLLRLWLPRGRLLQLFFNVPQPPTALRPLADGGAADVHDARAGLRRVLDALPRHLRLAHRGPGRRRQRRLARGAGRALSHRSIQLVHQSVSVRRVLLQVCQLSRPFNL